MSFFNVVGKIFNSQAGALREHIARMSRSPTWYMTWQYEPAADLDQSLAERLRRFPREPDLTVYGLRSFAALTIRSWLRVYHRLEIVGTGNLPREGSFVMVANHSSHLDTLCLLAALPLRKLHRSFPAAAQDYFFVSVPRLAVAAVIVNALPFARQTHIRQSLDLSRQLLANPGNILILFPEGTRTTTGQLGDFKPGIGLLVAGTTTPVVPCRLTGAFEAWPKGKSIPRPRRVQLTIGTPRTYETLPSGKESSAQISEDLRRAVLALA
jgi:1-acyl-sn-glycerol-3-phosphate acyltransferase